MTTPYPPPAPPPQQPPVPPPSAFPLRDSEEIQGNILAGFRKDHQQFVFLRFGDAASGRAWLAELLPRVSTTQAVASFNARFSDARRKRGLDDPTSMKAKWLNVGLTADGLTILAPQLATDLGQFGAFRAAHARRAAAAGDTGLSAPEHWLVGLDDQHVHALVTVAADDRDDLLIELDKLRQLNATHGVATVFEQRGATLPGNRAGHEHFGFKDGVSQPGVAGFDAQDKNSGPGHPDHPDPQVAGHLGSDIIAPGEFLLGYPRQPAGGDTTPRPHAPWMKDGSFQVWRRLKQDVPGFWAQVTANRNTPGFADPPTEDLLAAKLVGRWRSGTPLDLAPEKDDRSRRNPAGDNDFEFEADEAGHRCPRFAHIRKMYPRNNEQFGDERRRIIRRGIPFGLPFDPAGGRGHGVDAERGLCFMAFMASIEDQFEFLQQSWANSTTFPDGTAGPDPVIGDATRPSPITLRRPNAPDQRLEFQRFVHTTGSLYAFAPSLSTLGLLARGAL